MPFEGVVEAGGKRAQALGFPTANIPLGKSPVSGIYAAHVEVDGTRYAAVAYADQRRKLLEAHLLDVEVNLYGKQIRVVLLHKIRDEEVFVDEGAAARQIASDVAKAREFFKRSTIPR